MRNPTKTQITLERTFKATLEDIWDLWTTPEGIESWWGPEGFEVKVHALDLTPDGQMLYAMTATGPDQVGFMKRAGLPLTTETKVTYSEIVPQQRLAWATVADFIPGVAPYEVAASVELTAHAQGVRMMLTLDAMHDATWTERMVAGWKGQLGKLEKGFAASRTA